MATDSTTDLKDTLNLPETTFPMRANLVSREPERIDSWEKNNLYHKIQEKRKSAPAFILTGPHSLTATFILEPR